MGTLEGKTPSHRGTCGGVSFCTQLQNPRQSSILTLRVINAPKNT